MKRRNFLWFDLIKFFKTETWTVPLGKGSKSSSGGPHRVLRQHLQMTSWHHRQQQIEACIGPCRDTLRHHNQGSLTFLKFSQRGWLLERHAPPSSHTCPPPLPLLCIPSVSVKKCSCQVCCVWAKPAETPTLLMHTDRRRMKEVTRVD